MNLQEVAKRWHTFRPVSVQEPTKDQVQDQVQDQDQLQDQVQASKEHLGKELKICKFCNWSDYPFEREPAMLVDKYFIKAHNSSEWHRFNVHLQAHLGISSVTSDEFESLREEYKPKCPYNMEFIDFLLTQDMSNLLWEHCDSDEYGAGFNCSPPSDGTATSVCSKGPQLCFVNDQSEVIYVWKAIIEHYGSECFGSKFLSSKWLIFLCGGGYFAAGLFDNAQGIPLAHKAIHRYTVRKGQGGSQSLKDLSKHCRSAGSSLRRYNEAALVSDIIQTFNTFPGTADFVLFNVTASNRHVLDLSKFAPLPRSSLPFTTYRATWGEIQRCYHKLTQVRPF